MASTSKSGMNAILQSRTGGKRAQREEARLMADPEYAAIRALIAELPCERAERSDAQQDELRILIARKHDRAELIIGV